MDLRTITNVPLMSVGMNWHGVGGDLTFTFEHLADAMTAMNEDPHIVPPRLKLGHSDPRFADPDDPGHDPFYDGEPAFGSVINGRLINDGAVLIGDFVDMPGWLADAAVSVFPSRSIEGAYIDGHWEVETQGGKRYSFVLTACALLGVYRPAVTDLPDLRELIESGTSLVLEQQGSADGVEMSA